MKVPLTLKAAVWGSLPPTEVHPKMLLPPRITSHLLHNSPLRVCKAYVPILSGFVAIFSGSLGEAPKTFRGSRLSSEIPRPGVLYCTLQRFQSCNPSSFLWSIGDFQVSHNHSVQPLQVTNNPDAKPLKKTKVGSELEALGGEARPPYQAAKENGWGISYLSTKAGRLLAYILRRESWPSASMWVSNSWSTLSEAVTRGGLGDN